MLLKRRHTKVHLPLSYEGDYFSISYHVCTTDGLVAWQLVSLDKFCGIQPKLSIEAAFKGNAKITPSQKKELAAHRAECTTLPGCDIKFLNSYIDSAAFILQPSLGKIPIPEERANDPSIHEAAQSLESVKTFGGYVVDGTGFGKTMAALLFASQYGKYADHTAGYQPMCRYKASYGPMIKIRYQISIQYFR